MSDTSLNRARQDGCNALDLVPTCPNCGNLCMIEAAICIDCGGRLYPTKVDLDRAAGVGSVAMRRARIAARVREDSQAAREKVSR